MEISPAFSPFFLFYYAERNSTDFSAKPLSISITNYRIQITMCGDEMNVDVDEEVKDVCCEGEGSKDAKKIMVKMRCPEGED